MSNMDVYKLFLVFPVFRVFLEVYIPILVYENESDTGTQGR